MKISRLLTATVLLATLSSAVAAADIARWRVDPGKSSLVFSGKQTESPFQGRFTRFDAQIAFDPDHLDASTIAVTVDLASASTGDVQRDTALPGRDWFDVAEFPKATFQTTAITGEGGNAYEAAGTLTIRGLSKPLTLPFTLDIEGPAAHAKGHADLVRTAFGIGQGPWASGQWVALEVGVDFDLVATRAE